MAGKVTKLERIQEVADFLRKGLTRAEICQKMTKKVKTVDRTIDRYIKEATEIIAKENAAAEEIRQSQLSENLKSEIGAQIASTMELDLAMSKIAMGYLEVEQMLEDGPIIRSVTPGEMVAAARELYKRRGDYAPIKQANTTKSGEDIPQTLTEEHVDKLIQVIRETKAS
jgi:IS30 family transposase